MEHMYKSFEAKADGDKGTISGYFSTYDRIPDSYGDVIAPGAFTDTIKAREESGHPFPLCWNHDLDQIIGKVTNIEDTEKGPLMTADFFDTPLAQEKRELVKEGVVYLDLFEISIVPIPANQNAVMTDIKAGKRNSKKDADAIREAITLLQGVLGELEDTDDSEGGEDGAKANAGAKEPKQSNPKKDALLNYINNLKTED